MKEYQSRHHPVHGVKDVPNQSTIVMVNVCTKHRLPWLASDDVHTLLRQVWRDATGWLVGYYLIMPDHIHIFASPGDQNVSLENWVKYWKSQFSKQHKNPEHKWQSEHWDTRIRSHTHFTERWEYIRNNPVRAGLASHPDEWLYQGSIHDLFWYGYS